VLRPHRPGARRLRYLRERALLPLGFILSPSATLRTRPRSDSTIEDRLSTVRDLAIFLTTERGKDDWATTDVHDIEAFLAARTTNRRSHLTALRQFFAWARAGKLVLAGSKAPLWVSRA